MSKNTHPTLRTPEYKQARELLKQASPFALIDTCLEHKDFVPGSSIYNERFLREYFKLAADLDEPIVEVVQLIKK